MTSRPYVTATQHELPFSQLSWEQFERLCFRLAQARGYTRIEHLGRSGSEGGRDIVALDGSVRVAIQCKRVKAFNAADGKREINKLAARDETTRPHRIVFIVACAVSSKAREEIRKAWIGRHATCEFIAATELEAEVRQNEGILREFFNIPGARTGRGGASAADSELARESAQAALQIEIENRNWIASTRSIPFQRLLQAIEEIEHPAGRLEASRTFQHAVHVSGARSKVNDYNILKICEALEAQSLLQGDWKLRRMLARVVGDILGINLGKNKPRLIGAFCEPRLSTYEGRLLLAEASSEHTAAAGAIGGSIVADLVLSNQPQISWQLLRRWPVISPIISEKVSLKDIMEIRSPATRRMLLVTRLREERHSGKDLRNFLDGIAEGTGNRPRDTRLYKAMLAWAALNTAADLPRRKYWPGRFNRIEDLVRVANWRRVRDMDMVELVTVGLELDSIELDLLNAEGRYRPHPNERFSEGRYGHTRHYVRLAFRAAPTELVGALLSSLLDCADEGIRWAVAAELLNWWVSIGEYGPTIGLLERLLTDEHPWVVRETLHQLSGDATLCHAVGVDHVVRIAEESRTRAQAEGWGTLELQGVIQRVRALRPLR